MRKLFNNKIFLEVIAMIIILIAVIGILEFSKKQCINNNGKVVNDAFGIFDKCIYED